MEIKIKSIHFDTTEKLQAFIEKKIAKLEKSFEDIQKVEVQLKVEKPATLWRRQVILLRRVRTFVSIPCADNCRNLRKN